MDENSPQPSRAGFWPVIGSIASALMASACCWVPMLLLLFGASAAGVSSIFAEYRPYFLGLSVVLLGLAFYRTYRTGGACRTACGCSRAPERARRITLWVATSMVLVSAIFPNTIGALLGGTSAAELEAQDTATVELRIDGMTCAACEATIRNAVMSVPGVRDAAVSFGEKRVVVALDPVAPAHLDAIIAAIEATGYDAWLAP